MTHRTKNEAMSALHKMFADTSVPQEDTLEALEEVRDQADEYIMTLREELDMADG